VIPQRIANPLALRAGGSAGGGARLGDQHRRRAAPRVLGGRERRRLVPVQARTALSKGLTGGGFAMVCISGSIHRVFEACTVLHRMVQGFPGMEPLRHLGLEQHVKGVAERRTTPQHSRSGE